MENFSLRSKRGFSLIELMITIGLAGVLLPALVSGFVATRSGRAQSEQRQKAISLVREGQEAMRVFREADWTTFASKSGPTLYYPCKQSNTWSVCTGVDPTVPAGFTRTIQINDVYRDSSFGIVSSTTPGSYDDPSTKQITTTVGWSTPIANSQVSSNEFLTRYGNLCVDSDAITFGDCSVARTGTAQPAASGGDWCNPSSTPLVQQGLSGGLHAVNAAQLSSGGNIITFIGAGSSANGNTYANININDPSSPVVPSIQSINNGNYTPKIKTNSAYNDTTYGYLATQQHSTQGQGTIVNLSDLSQIGSLDLNSSENGQSIYVMNNFRGTGKNIAFLTSDKGKLYAFDITSLNTTTCTSGSPCHYTPISGSSISLDGTGMKVVVNTSSTGTFAYIATTSSSKELDIVNETTLSSPSLTSISTGNSQSGVDLFLDPNRLRVYLITKISAQPDFFTIDVNPSDTVPPQSWYKKILNQYTTTNSMNPSGVVFVTGNKAIIVGTGGTRNYQVIDVSTESDPPYTISSNSCSPGSGGLNVSYNIFGIATIFSHANRAYSYILTDDSGNEFKMIEGGTGVVGSGNGTTVSTTFDAGRNVTFNYFTGTTDPNLSYFIDIEHGPCSSATFNNYASISTGSISLSSPSFNPGQCLSFEVKNNGSTPKSFSVSFNYSP